jgi:hypothetical protein
VIVRFGIVAGFFVVVVHGVRWVMLWWLWIELQSALVGWVDVGV